TGARLTWKRLATARRAGAGEARARARDRVAWPAAFTIRSNEQAGWTAPSHRRPQDVEHLIQHRGERVGIVADADDAAHERRERRPRPGSRAHPPPRR